MPALVEMLSRMLARRTVATADVPALGTAVAGTLCLVIPPPPQRLLAIAGDRAFRSRAEMPCGVGGLVLTGSALAGDQAVWMVVNQPPLNHEAKPASVGKA